MRCDETQEQVSLFLDSELAEVAQGPMFRHLEGCSECRSFFDSVLRLRKGAAAEREGLLREADAMLPGAEALVRRLRREEPGHAAGWRRLLGGGLRVPMPVAVAVAIVILIAGIVLGARIPGGRGSPVSPADGLESVSQPAVVVVCPLPPVEVVASSVRQ